MSYQDSSGGCNAATARITERQCVCPCNTIKSSIVCVSQNPSKLSQAGALLGRAVLRCQDEDASVRAAAQQCARLVLLIAGKYEGLTSDDAELEQAFSSMSLDNASCNELLAKVSKGHECVSYPDC